jgi:regulator of sigma E protease
MSFITSLLAFLVAIAILVAIHEFGHYWVAKKLGVKILQFSIGFGKPLWKRVGGDDKTEYIIAAIPLGGYVKMLDEREGEVAKEELPRAFNRQPVSSRIAIVAAGPVFNFLFAIVAYAFMYMVGVNGVKPVIGEVYEGSIAAQAGLSGDSLITSVNGRQTPSWEAATLTLIKEALDSGQVSVGIRNNNGALVEHSLDLSDSAHLLDEGDVLGNIGIKPWRPRVDPVFDELIDSGSAARSGLKSGDKVLKIDGQSISLWEEMVTHIKESPGKPLDFIVEREGQRLDFTVTPDSVEQAGKQIGRIGATPQVDQAAFDDMRVNVRYGLFESITRGAQRTWDMSVLTLRVLWKMVTGQASLKNISGPLTIAEFAGVSALIGVAAFLSFLGLVSVSLGVLNLLPVPVLDGGHLLFYLIEIIKGSPLSEGAEAFGQRIGLALLGSLMVVAFYNDITRLFS